MNYDYFAKILENEQWDLVAEELLRIDGDISLEEFELLLSKKCISRKYWISMLIKSEMHMLNDKYSSIFRLLVGSLWKDINSDLRYSLLLVILILNKYKCDFFDDSSFMYNVLRYLSEYLDVPVDEIVSVISKNRSTKKNVLELNVFLRLNSCLNRCLLNRY